MINLPVEHPDIDVEPLFIEDRVLIAPKDHPLYDCDEVTLDELAEHELLLEAPGTRFVTYSTRAATEAGVTLRARAEFDGMRLLASLAFAGFGAGVVPASAIPTGLGGDWRAVPVVGVPRRSVGLIRRRRALPTPAVRVVGEVVAQVAREASGSVHGIDAAD